MRDMKASDLQFFQNIFAELRREGKEHDPASFDVYCEEFLIDRIDTVIEATEAIQALLVKELRMLRAFKVYLEGQTPAAGGAQ